jgi:predicted nucleic acid-binding protein
LIVLDASAMLEVLLITPRGLRIEERLFAPNETLHAPHVLDLEVAQVLRRYCLTGDLEPARAEEALADLMALVIDRYSHELFLPRIWELRHNITAYDAAYIALAEALSAPLLTADRRLAKASGHSAVIEVLAP